MDAEKDIVDVVAGYLGAPGPALRILLSLLMAYPMAFFYRKYMYDKPAVAQHIVNILCGSYLGYFNYGWLILHAYICIIVQYFVLLFSSGTVFSIAFSFIFQMTYLLAEYYFTETATYDIKWTIPHCVLTLRLIGQTLDIYDGTRSDNDLSNEQKQLAIRKFPTLLESMGHSFYPGSFMIGPQYSLKRYLDFTEGKFNENGKPGPSISAGMQRLMLGLFYVMVYQLGSAFINNDYVTSSGFKELAMWQKMLVVGLYGKLILYKYVSCWIVTEGACIVAGISHNGKNAQGEIQWDGVENVNIGVYERSFKFAHIIASFNKCTNLWIARYVYKRLKFMNNRYISQSAALLFLAVWHGLHSGYYMCFFMEFLVMNFEKDMEVILTKNPSVMKWHSSSLGYWIDIIVLKTLVTCYFGYCTLPFGLLKSEKWWYVYKDLYFSGTVMFGLWPLYKPLVKSIFGSEKPASPRQTDDTTANNGLKTD